MRPPPTRPERKKERRRRRRHRGAVEGAEEESPFLAGGIAQKAWVGVAWKDAGEYGTRFRVSGVECPSSGGRRRGVGMRSRESVDSVGRRGRGGKWNALAFVSREAIEGGEAARKSPRGKRCPQRPRTVFVDCHCGLDDRDTPGEWSSIFHVFCISTVRSRPPGGPRLSFGNSRTGTWRLSDL